MTLTRCEEENSDSASELDRADQQHQLLNFNFIFTKYISINPFLKILHICNGLECIFTVKIFFKDLTVNYYIPKFNYFKNN